MEFVITNPNMYMDHDGSLVFEGRDVQIRITNDGAYISDIYGNEMVVTNNNTITHTQNSPTYEELYEHWLKTKGE